MSAPARQAMAGAVCDSVPDAAIRAARAADDKLGANTVVLAMGDLLGVTDAFVVTEGRNSRQVKTLVEEIEERVRADSGRTPDAVEGLREMRWVLMDYGDFVVHVFDEDTRHYYDLERLWGDAPRIDWESDSGSADLARP